MYNVLLYEINENGQKVLSNKSDLRTLKKGDNLFADSSFEEWKMPLNYLTSGKEMFAYSLLASWNVDLPLLVDATQMFEGTFIKSFDSNLDSLQTSDYMFRGSEIESFTTDMNSLNSAIGMFTDCENLTNYTSYNNSLTDATDMFKGCTKLSDFVSFLGNLDNGTGMFTDCKLNPTSVAIIINTIKDQSTSDEEHVIDIGIDAIDEFESITKFAVAAGWSNWMEMMQAIENKGWKATWYAHGTMIECDKIIVNRDFDVASFNVTGLSEEFALSGNMNISVLGLIDSLCDTTITFTNVTLGGQPLGGQDVIKLKVPFDSQGYIPNVVSFKVLFTTFVDNIMYLLHGEFFIAGAENSISVATNGLRAEIKEDFVWVEYDNNGVYVDSNLVNLSDGYNLFYNNYDLITFDSELPILESAENMFYNCSNMTTFSSNLRTLSNGNYMFYGCKKLSNPTLTDLTGLTTGTYMFYNCNKITDWSLELPNLIDGTYMFYYNKLRTFNSNLENLQDGTYMFYYNTSLTTWTTPLPNLQDGTHMFYNNSLKEWTTPLPKLQDGYYMFYGNDFSTWDVDLPELTDGYEMFWYCSNLTSFTGDTPKLTRGNYMFENCPLVHFRGNLKQLTSGTGMFEDAKFDAETVQYVVNQLKNNQCNSNATIYLGVDKSLFEDQSVRHILGIYAGDEQPGEDEDVVRKYSYSKITNAKGKKWSVTTYWN